MDQFARIVVGYHGCNTSESVEFSKSLFAGTAQISEWQLSTNSYDWLGNGIYFWEHGPERAHEWAGENGSVIGAIIQLGRCFDLTDIRYTRLLPATYESVVELYEDKGWALPTNGRDQKNRQLDCLVINQIMDDMDNDMDVAAPRFQTVRSAFEEGDAAFPGSQLKTQTHIQIAVRDPSCILGVFRPNLSMVSQ